MSKLAEVLEGACATFDEWLSIQSHFPNDHMAEDGISDSVEGAVPFRTSDLLACALDRVALAGPPSHELPQPAAVDAIIQANLWELIDAEVRAHWEKAKAAHEDEEDAEEDEDTDGPLRITAEPNQSEGRCARCIGIVVAGEGVLLTNGMPMHKGCAIDVRRYGA